MKLNFKYLISVLIVAYVLSFAQFLVFDHDSCEEGHSHQKQCPLHKHCCGFSHLNVHNAITSAGEKLSPPAVSNGSSLQHGFILVENLFVKTVFHPPRPACSLS
ncbi:MAG TPA: hypothetical protein PK467_02630 [Candidatus Wallbacteria bacterium]|nr:hypothetical protein [Candidatus Wallbacteria bacterium]